jgi:hypothetical protein
MIGKKFLPDEKFIAKRTAREIPELSWGPG